MPLMIMLLAIHSYFFPNSNIWSLSGFSSSPGGAGVPESSRCLRLGLPISFIVVLFFQKQNQPLEIKQCKLLSRVDKKSAGWCASCSQGGGSPQQDSNGVRSTHKYRRMPTPNRLPVPDFFSIFLHEKWM